MNASNVRYVPHRPRRRGSLSVAATGSNYLSAKERLAYREIGERARAREQAEAAEAEAKVAAILRQHREDAQR